MGRRPGPPQVRVHGGKWYARFTANGRRREEPLDVPASRPRREAEAAAEEARAKAILEPRAVTVDADGRERRIAALVDPYLDSVAALGRDVRYVKEQGYHLRTHFQRVDDDGQPTRWGHLDDITAKSIADYQVERIADEISTVTLYKELVTLSRFLKWAKRQGLIASVPEIERPTQSTEYQVPHLAPRDVKRLIRKLPKHLRLWATFTWMMALRLTESLSIEWRDVDAAGKHLTVRAEIDKAGQDWTLPLDEAAPVLAKLKRGAPRDRIFPPIAWADRAALGEAAKAMGLPHVTAHHLRHARITEWAHGSKELASVQFMARHTNIATTGLYVRSGTAQAARMLAEVRRGRKK